MARREWVDTSLGFKYQVWTAETYGGLEGLRDHGGGCVLMEYVGINSS